MTTKVEDKIWNAAIQEAFKACVSCYIVEESEAHKFVNQHIRWIAHKIRDKKKP